MANSAARAGVREAGVTLDTEFNRGLGLYDSTMVVVGSMIGSGIFIVSADMARTIGSPGWLLLAWVVTGVLTVTAALSYGELASMMPRAGGQYVYLREAFSPLWGFLYGWTLFLVIQTGTIAAGSVWFARYFRALAGLIVVGVLLGWNHAAVSGSFGDLWRPRGLVEIVPGLTAATAFGLFV